MKSKYMMLFLGTCFMSLSVKAVEYEYNTAGTLSKLTYDSGGYTVYEYDTSTGKVSTETYYKEDGTKYTQTSYTYYQGGDMRKDVNVYNNGFTSYWNGYYYDSNGNLETEQSRYVTPYSQTEALIDYAYTYNSDGTVATKTNTNTGDIWAYSYNDNKTLASETAIGNTDDEILSEYNKKVYTYNENGKLEAVEFYNNKMLMTKEYYDSNGILLSIATLTDGESNGSTWAHSDMDITDPYDRNGYYASVIADIGYYDNERKSYESYTFKDSDGEDLSVTSQEWNENGRLIYDADTLYGDDGYDKATYWEYDENGHLISEDFEHWDGNGEEFIEGYSKSFVYDAKGTLLRETVNQYGNNWDNVSETTSTYDLFGYKTVYQDGKKVGMFDKDGNPYQRRIYTIDEANQVAGPVNRVSIRYK